MARREREQQTSGGGGAGWLTTYTDLCTLLLTFFVLLLTMSVIDPERKREALNSLVGAFGFLPSGRSPIGTLTGQDIREPSDPMMKSSPLSYDFLKELTVRNNLDPEVEILREEDRVMIRVSDRIVFEEGSTTLSSSGERFLALLAMYLTRNIQEIEIRGHTDRYEMLDAPDWFERSWVVSTERAMAVYQFFLRTGIEARRMSAHGMSYFRPVVDERDAPHLRYKNRRVEIVLGKNPTLPTDLLTVKPERHPFFSYKNFFFRLFPEREDDSHGE